MTTRVQGAWVAALVLVVAACGEAGPAATPTAAAPTGTPVTSELGPGCELLTDEQVGQALDATVEAKEEGETEAQLSTCEYDLERSDGTSGSAVLSLLASGGSEALDEQSGRFANTFGTFEPYDGIGDRAAWDHSGGLYVLEGDRLVFTEVKFGGSADRDGAEALAGAMLDNLP